MGGAEGADTGDRTNAISNKRLPAGKVGDSLGTDHRPRSTDQVRWCACRDAITELAWDGDGANAAELRAEDEYHEFRRAAIEQDMSESVSSGLSWLSDTSNSLKLRVVSCQLQKFDVNDDWVVIDKFDYASADATDGVPAIPRSVALCRLAAAVAGPATGRAPRDWQVRPQ